MARRLNHVDSREQGQQLLRLRATLADLFERQRRWGSENARDSALYQWLRALAVFRNLKQLDPSFPAAPGLYRQVGLCYRQSNDPSRAREWCLIAAETFADAGEDDQARQMLAQAREVGGGGETLTADQRARMSACESRLEGAVTTRSSGVRQLRDVARQEQLH
jgi:hypothetical protein